MFATVANAVTWPGPPWASRSNWCFRSSPASLGIVQTIDGGLARTLFSRTRCTVIVDFWAHPRIHRVEDDHPARGGRAVFTATRIWAVSPSSCSWSTASPSVCTIDDGPSARNGWQLHSDVAHRLCVGTDAARDSTITASLEMRRTAAWRPRRRPAGSASCRAATGRAVLRYWTRLDLLASAGSAGSSRWATGMNAMAYCPVVTAHFHRSSAGSVVIMYFATRIPDMAVPHRPASMIAQPPAMAAVVVVDRHDGHDGALALARAAGPIGDASADLTMPTPSSPPGACGAPSALRRLCVAAFAPLLVRNLRRLAHTAPAGGGPTPFVRLAVHPPHRVPAALNGFGLWNVLVLVLMLLGDKVTRSPSS